MSSRSLNAFILQKATTFFMPQKYHATVGGQMVCTFQQNFNPFVQKLAIDFSYDQNKTFDRRLGLAAAILLLAIEGRQA